MAVRPPSADDAIDSTAMAREVVGFLSYQRGADTLADGRISELRDELERLVRLRGATGFSLFQDRVPIRWGEDWERALQGALDESVFFLPVLTPQFFDSAWCRKEAEAFLDRVERGEARTRVLPLYVVKDLRLEQAAMRRRDPLRDRLARHQHRDLRAHLHPGWKTGGALQALDALAEAIADWVVQTEHEDATIAELVPPAGAGPGSAIRSRSLERRGSTWCGSPRAASRWGARRAWALTTSGRATRSASAGRSGWAGRR